MKLQSLEEYYVEELKDLYDAEKQLLRALPRMAKAAAHEELKAAFEEHAEQTQEQINRLERILKKHGKDGRGHRCKAMLGLIEEGREMMDEKPSPNIMDVGLITTAQKVEHYEIAGYGCTTTYAKLLGLKDEAELLHRTLTEEKETDTRLTKLAKTIINPDAENDAAEFDDDQQQPRSKRHAQGRSSTKSSAGRANSIRTGGSRARSGGRTARAATSGRNGRARSSSGSSGAAKSTQDLDEIRQWVEARGGKPAKVCGTGKGNDPGLLRIDFPGYSGGDSLQAIPWDEWYQKFQETNLTFIYQDKTKGGKESRFFKLVCQPKNARA
jgi:ferritin-like metal-binding protein YciE